MTRFDERTAVVTGAGSGIGRETAVALAEDGANVVVTDVDREGGEETVDRIADETGADATFVAVDVTDPDEVDEMIETALERYGGLEIAVNNAGLGSPLQRTADVDQADWDRILDVNLTGVWRCLAREIDAMLEDGGGAIVNVASILGKVGTAGAPAYTASKHGVVGLTKVAALDYATEGIRVNAVCPGYVETPMLEDAGLFEDDATVDELVGLHPLGRLGDQREVADAVAWLCSPEASFVTGEALAVDGGYLSR